MTASTKNVNEIVSVLSDEELVQLVKEYDYLEMYCYIGECFLRDKVEELCADQPMSFHLIATGLVLKAQRELLSRHEIV